MSSSLFRDDEDVDAFVSHGSPPHAFGEAASQLSSLRKSRASVGTAGNALK
jgi:hypothetical protein